jgi:hypothetical protein
LVGEYYASGVSAEEFAGDRGLKVATLERWCRKLRDEVRRHETELVSFIQVQPNPPPLSSSIVEAQVGTVTLRFESGADILYITTLLTSLSRKC